MWTVEELTTMGGSMVATSTTTCSCVPTSSGVLGLGGLISLMKPFGEYFGIWSNWRNFGELVLHPRREHSNQDSQHIPFVSLQLAKLQSQPLS